MAMFMTKVWGFHGPSMPLQFSTAGWRVNARELLQRTPGALVLLVAADQSIFRKMLGVCPWQTLRKAKRAYIASIARLLSQGMPHDFHELEARTY